ncbi:MAG: glycosyltransferase [Bdellovibrionia bacterium]
MNIRIYSPFLPYPIAEGAFRVIFDQAYSLIQLGHQVELVCWKNRPQDFLKRTEIWQKDWPRPQFIHLPLSSSSTQIRVLRSWLNRTASPETYYYPKTPLRFKPLLQGCDLAIYHYSFAHAWLKKTKHLPSEKKRVVHFHNLESDLSRLRAQNSSGISQWVHRSNARTLASHELELTQFASELWFLSPVDLRLFQERLKLSHASRSLPCALRLVPPTYSTHASQRPSQMGSQDSITPFFNNPSFFHSPEIRLGFIGGFDFRPNLDSAQWILEHLLPRLEQSSFQGKIVFAGQGAQRVLGPQVRSPHLEILPDQFDPEGFFSSLSAMLVPHTSGSGVRIKLLDALARRIPVLATEEAVERLHPELQTHPLLFCSSQAERWANHILQANFRSLRASFSSTPLPDPMNGLEIYGHVSSPAL